MGSKVSVGQSYDPALEGQGTRAFAYRFSKAVMRLIAFLSMRKEWSGYENVPATGGVIVAINHISELDPVNVAMFVDRCHRHPRFMAKAELFKVKGLKFLLENTGQIPVYRESREAGEALSAAIKRLEAGGCVLVYPEGTITKDPKKWPMVARTGIARLVLATGAPVIPVAQWGVQGLPKKYRPWKRSRSAMVAGPAVDLARFHGKTSTTALMNEVTEEVMAALRAGVAELRQEPLPDEIWNNRRKEYVPFKGSEDDRNEEKSA